MDHQQAGLSSAPGGTTVVDGAAIIDGNGVHWSNARRYYVLILLCVVALFNFIDRQIITILMEPIKKEFGVSDSVMGLLTGLLFSSFYIAAGIPIAWLADRVARTRIIALSLGFWSVMTSIGGFATSFSMLALTRIGVAVGEAGATPASHSLLSDLFPLSQRGMVLSLLGGVSAIGIGAGVFLGGWLAEAFDWRTAFLIVGIPGVFLAILVLLTLPEPPRGMSEGLGQQADNRYPTSQVLKFLWRQKSYRYACLTTATGAIGGYGTLTWGPTFYLRVHGMSPGDVGLWMGLSIACSLFFGQLVNGFVTDRLGRFSLDWYLRIPGISVAIAIPFGLTCLFVDDWRWSVFFFGCFQFFLVPHNVSAYLVGQTVVSPRMRATASVILILFTTLFGLGLSPFFIGMINDLLTPSFGVEAVRYSLMVAILFGVVCIAVAWLGSFWVRRDYAHMVASLDAEK